MHASVVIVGRTSGVDRLTYAIPPALEGSVQAGHRVLVELRSRKLTAVVVEVGSDLAPPGTKLKPVLEVLGPEPLFDRPHLQLMEFLASYYLAPLGQAYRSVVPSAARIESRAMLRLAARPDRLAEATMNPLERQIVARLSLRPLTERQLHRFGGAPAVRSAITRLSTEGLIARHESTRGRHRDPLDMRATLVPDAGIENVRGKNQRAIVEMLSEAGRPGLHVTELKRRFVAGAPAALKALRRRGIVEFHDDRELPPNAEGTALPVASGLDLTPEQRSACDVIASAIQAASAATFLLWGVTASGKTEVYQNLAERALSAGRQVLILVPEIALADEIVRSFRGRFGPLVAVAHSAQSVAERWSSLTAALKGKARIMIGPRSVVFAPLHDPGLIVVDEEHDTAYKSEEGIRYNARDLAVALGRFAGCPVVLGSATPSAESFANARAGRYRLLRLSRRINDRPMARVEVIDLRRRDAGPGDAAVAGPAASPQAREPFSSRLVDALRDNQRAGGQSIVFLNRRGFHSFLECRHCGNVIACLNCSVSMTYHRRDRTLRCHYCGARAAARDDCPECGATGLEGQGFGTERVVESLGRLLPEARVARLDSDTGRQRGARAKILAALRRREIDVLVGTQMVTKGFDFPGVTLVAVVLADMGLNLPDFRSAERTFQLLTQVAGRAGRGPRPGRVLIQTYNPNHYSIRAARDQDYARFIRREMRLRRELGYPPFQRLAMVRIEGADSRRVSSIASTVAKLLGRYAAEGGLQVLGPAPAPIERIQKRYRWQVMLKAPERRPIRTALKAMRAGLAAPAEQARVRLIIDIDPIRML